MSMALHLPSRFMERMVQRHSISTNWVSRTGRVRTRLPMTNTLQTTSFRTRILITKHSMAMDKSSRDTTGSVPTSTTMMVPSTTTTTSSPRGPTRSARSRLTSASLKKASICSVDSVPTMKDHSQYISGPRIVSTGPRLKLR
ncbi:MAG: hypothetical protein BWY95_02596 [Bacteroidetes bacterium ADurb.BinA104]|nr:MAG: hypothetical protein BWY95_02596 [Bacteroidetes bacterium ADurb.BinA104]